MTHDDFENELPPDLESVAETLRKGRAVADGHLLERVLHRVRSSSPGRRRRSTLVPRLAIVGALAVAGVTAAQLSHVNVAQGVANLASSLTTSNSTSPTGSAAGAVYCSNGGYTCYVFTPGYWKNHSGATTPLLPVFLGGYKVDTFAKAQAVFNAMNCSDAVGCLAGQLLAAELNVKNGVGAPACASTAISSANNFLSTVPVDTGTTPPTVGYAGPTGTYSLTSSQRATAIALNNTLSNFNAHDSC